MQQGLLLPGRIEALYVVSCKSTATDAVFFVWMVAVRVVFV